MSWHSSLDASVSRFRSDVGRILCAQQPSITWSRVGRERQVAYVALGTLVASSAAANVGKALLEDLKSFVGRRQADGKTGIPLYLIVDEAARIANMALVEIMTMARSSGVRVILAVQTLSGLERELGRHGAQEIVANCNTRVQLQAADVQDAKAFSDQVGTFHETSMSPNRLVELAPYRRSRHQSGVRATLRRRAVSCMRRRHHAYRLKRSWHSPPARPLSRPLAGWRSCISRCSAPQTADVTHEHMGQFPDKTTTEAAPRQRQASTSSPR